MRITLHIGAGKTGTSSIQKGLLKNAGALESAGVYLPAADLSLNGKVQGYHVFGFQTLMRSEDVEGGERFDALLSGIVARAQKKDCSRVLFSAENLSNQIDWKSLLATGLAKHDVDVIFYIRRQDLYFLSAWQQWGLKNGLSFEQFFFRQKDHRGDWGKTIQAWEQMAASVDVRVYERERLIDGDVVTDFFHQIGLDVADLELSGLQENHSYSLAAEELALSSPHLFDDAHDSRFFHFLDAAAMGSQRKRPRDSRISFERRLEILDYFEESNDFVAAHYQGADGLPLRFTRPQEADFDYVPPEQIEKLKDGLLAEVLFNTHADVPKSRSSQRITQAPEQPQHTTTKPHQKEVTMANTAERYSGSLSSEFSVDGVNFVVDLTPGKQRRPSEENSFTIVKSLPMMNFYFSMAERLQAKRILELGVFQGGSFALVDRLFQPEVLVGIEIDKPVPAIETYCEQQRAHRNVRIYFETSQADENRVPQILEQDFAEGLDLVIDDASHAYDLTLSSLELVWPKLAVGGTYIIEDWAWSFSNPMQNSDHPWFKRPGLVNLIFELVADLGSYGHIRSISMDRGRVMLVKGGDSPNFLSAEKLRGRRFTHI